MPVITPRQIDPTNLNVDGLRNICAFLDTIAFTEGTDIPRQRSNPYFLESDTLLSHPYCGYDVIVGGSLMPIITGSSPPKTDYSKHPNRVIQLNANLSSTAAGRYQILYRFWKVYQKQLNLPDFSPLSQDLYAIQQLREQRAYGRLLAGEFEKAVLACNDIWASLPGSPYGQHTYSMAEAKAVYVLKGGTFVGQSFPDNNIR